MHGGFREKLKVIRDNSTEKFLTENWDQYVNDIIPVNISHLFFFDGEKIATYATPQGIRDLLANGIGNLFGIDVIERLQKDLRILERRQSITAPSIDTSVINQKEKELCSLHNDIESMVEKKEVLEKTELNLVRNKLAGVMQEYRALGASLRERREEILRRVSQAEANLNSCCDEMKELASSELPLLLIQDLLQDVAGHAAEEQKIQNARAMVDNLHERDARMLDLIQNLPEMSFVLAALEEFCRTDMEKQEKLANCRTLINVSDTGVVRLNILLQERLPELQKSVRNILGKFFNSKDEMKAAKLEQSAIPPEDSIDGIVKKRDLLIAQITQLENEIAGIEKELGKINQERGRLEADINIILGKIAKSELADRDTKRFVQHSQLARQTLEKFGSTVLQDQIGRVEHSALESYKCLLRKDRLVSTLSINPETFKIILRDTEQHPIAIEQLSTGERQLLVIALIWGMAKASGKLLPVAIDTPMGRLDSIHRDRLVDRYFPNASHQLLLFATDEEIDEDYMCQLRPWVGKSYYLNHDDTTGTTIVSNEFEERI